MPDLAPVYKDLRCWEFLDLFGGTYFVDRRERLRRVEACLAEVGLEGKRNAMAGTLSRGMTQRLVLAKTILPEPRVLLLDEPASGLDPIARMELRDLVRRLAGEGRTILVSSHILSELSEFCTSIGITPVISCPWAARRGTSPATWMAEGPMSVPRRPAPRSRWTLVISICMRAR